MEIFTKLNDNHKNLSLALGFFDGVHLGHKAVIEKAVDFAHQNNLKSAVITFSSHPAQKFNKNFEGYIMPPEKRFEYFEKSGVDYCWAVNFDDISNIEAEDYIKDVLVKNFAPKAITSGFNHNFGKNKKGNSALLKEYSSAFGYEYFEIPPIVIDGTTVSSSAIRKFIRSGDIKKLNEFSERNFEISGVVQNGQKLGAKLGFKTANLTYPSSCVMLKFGVYDTDIFIDGDKYRGITNFGVKPTFNNTSSQPVLEVHILNFDKDIYGKNVRVEFKNFIRDEKKFDSASDLKDQINRDLEKIID